MCIVQSFLRVLLWVCRLVKSERWGESPSLSASKLCQLCTVSKAYEEKQFSKSFGQTDYWWAGSLLSHFVIVVKLFSSVLCWKMLVIKPRPKFVCTCFSGCVAWKKQAIGWVAFALCKETWYALCEVWVLFPFCIVLIPNILTIVKFLVISVGDATTFCTCFSGCVAW